MRCSCYIINKLHTTESEPKFFPVLWLLLKRQSDIIILFVNDEKKSRKSSDRLPLSISWPFLLNKCYTTPFFNDQILKRPLSIQLVKIIYNYNF